MKVTKHTIKGIEVLIILMGNLAGFYFEHENKPYGGFVKLESPDLFNETIPILTDQAYDIIQQVKH
jgi:hypothetical protein